ncbi:MAG TPA: hypothetical protein VHM70_24620 [Polyangiaceae bacterium]|nr:hypothetical protein [Polyangiaceae bacterium]
MNVQLLIDDIVRQTTVLIAQLSTAAGVRAPLSHVADQVFAELARELEQQGVRRKVAADMFGMALRSYQLKLRRVAEAGVEGRTSLWQVLYTDLRQGSQTREALQRRHKTYPGAQVAAVLKDMVKNGVAYRSGRGLETLYGLTSLADRERLDAAESERVVRDLCWYLVASGAAATRSELSAQLRVPEPEIATAIEALTGLGQLSEQVGQLSARPFERGVGGEQGWEASVLDHFRAVTTAIAAKVSRPRAQATDQVGGSTRSFIVHPEHPLAVEVYELLARTREHTAQLWRRVEAHNQVRPPPTSSDRVTFYFGQNIIAGALEEPHAEAAPDAAANAGEKVDS